MNIHMNMEIIDVGGTHYDIIYIYPNPNYNPNYSPHPNPNPNPNSNPNPNPNPNPNSHSNSNPYNKLTTEINFLIFHISSILPTCWKSPP